MIVENSRLSTRLLEEAGNQKIDLSMRGRPVGWNAQELVRMASQTINRPIARNPSCLQKRSGSGHLFACVAHHGQEAYGQFVDAIRLSQFDGFLWN